jgi:hypothetical protein
MWGSRVTVADLFVACLSDDLVATGVIDLPQYKIQLLFFIFLIA